MGSNVSEPAPAPLIGLSTYVERAHYGVWSETAALVPYSYVGAVVRAGGAPVLLPPSPWDASAIVEKLDGLVLTGGPDLEPGLYGAEPHSLTDVPRRERDAWEIALCRAALQRSLPLLAICRGLQVLNVACGGTLHQHLPDVLGTDAHRSNPGEMTPNAVHLSPASTVASILGDSTEGLCHHHQAIDNLGKDLVAVGFAVDGTVEAVERPGPALTIGVQWHPEDNPNDDRLFIALVRAAAGSMKDGRPELPAATTRTVQP